MKKPKMVKGHAWVGVWSDGTLGWGMPQWVSHNTTKRRYPNRLSQTDAPWFWDNENPVYLVEVKLKVVTDKLGRPITRKNKKGAPK